MKIKMRDRKLRRSYFSDDALLDPKKAVYTFFFDFQRSAKDCRYGWVSKPVWAMMMREFKKWFERPRHREQWYGIKAQRGWPAERATRPVWR